MHSDAEQIIAKVKQRLPNIQVVQVEKALPTDDDGLWRFSLPGVEPKIQIESPEGKCLFLVESDEQCCGDALKARSVEEAESMIFTYPINAAEGHSVTLRGERWWQ